MAHYDKGEHIMGQICLPKPPKDLNYERVDPVPGMLIPNDE